MMQGKAYTQKDILSSPVIQEMMPQLQKILKKAARGKYGKQIKKIVNTPGFNQMFLKTQIYAFFYEVNSRGIHTLRVLFLAIKIAEYLKSKYKVKIDYSRLVAICLAHDAFHFPGGHVAESILKEYLGYDWKHAAQAIWMFYYILGYEIDETILDGIACHSEINKPEIFCRNNKQLNAESWLVLKDLENSTIEGAIAKISDKFTNAYYDLDDARKTGLIFPEAEEIISQMGGTAETVESYLISGLKIVGGNIVIDDEVFAVFKALQDIAYEHIHYEKKLLKQRMEMKSIMKKVLVGTELLIKKQQKEIEGVWITYFLNKFLTAYGDKYEGIEALPFVQNQKEKIIAKDIFGLLSDIQLFEAYNNLVQLSHADSKLHVVMLEAGEKNRV